MAASCSTSTPSDIPAGTRIVTEGAALARGWRAGRARRPRSPTRRPANDPGGLAGLTETQAVTGLSLRNPIAVLMLCIGARRLRRRRHAAHERRHLPGADAARAHHRHALPGLGPKDVEKTISWRLEKYVSATPGVDHVESLSRNNFSIIYVWLEVGHRSQRRADARAAAGRLRDGRRPEVARRPAAVRPPVRPLERAGRAGRRDAARDTPGRSSTTTRSTTSSRCSRGSPEWPARRPTAGGMRQINVVVDPGQGAGARPHGGRRRAGGRESNALLPVGRVHRADVRRERLHERDPRRVKTIGDAPIKVERRQRRAHPRRRARRGRRDARRRSPCRSTARTRSTSTSSASRAATRSRSSTR